MRKSDGYGGERTLLRLAVLWSKGKDAYLITHGNDYAIALSLEDGSEIWRVGDLNPKSATTRRCVSWPRRWPRPT